MSAKAKVILLGLAIIAVLVIIGMISRAIMKFWMRRNYRYMNKMVQEELDRDYRKRQKRDR